ncbi:MAG TPA: hypothetical protein VKB46_23370 [Pyrinomonadaceae bacterium]|nr:hypothetical protein [Pyrinomonadaceae bacterium]
MRNSNTKKIRRPVALLLVLVASIVGLTPAFSTSVRADFSIYDVSGNYVLSGQSWDYGTGGSNEKQPVPGSGIGLITFTPDSGTFHARFIGRVLGENLDIVRDGTYTVDPDGHGAMTFLSLNGNVRHRDFYLINGGTEIKWVDTQPPGAAVISGSGTMTKQ